MLTPREQEIVRLLAEGATNRAIAARLNIAPDTVKSHLRNIFDKLDTHSRAAVVAVVFRERLA